MQNRNFVWGDANTIMSFSCLVGSIVKIYDFKEEKIYTTKPWVIKNSLVPKIGYVNNNTHYEPISNTIIYIKSGNINDFIEKYKIITIKEYNSFRKNDPKFKLLDCSNSLQIYN